MDLGGHQIGGIRIQADEKDHSQIVKGEPGDVFQELPVPLLGDQTEGNAAFCKLRIQDLLAYGGWERGPALQKGEDRGAYGLHRYAFLVLVIQGFQIDDWTQGIARGEYEEDIRTYAVIFAERLSDKLSILACFFAQYLRYN